MSFSLQDFEQKIPNAILGRGLEYFEEGLVHNLARHGDSWEAEVTGSDSYVVEVELLANEVAGWFCDCPYDYGPLCKHVVAVLYAIRQELQEPGSPSPKKRGRKPKSASGKKPDPIEEIVAGLPEGDLRDLLRYFSQREEGVRSHLLARYAHLLPKGGRSDFQALVRSTIRSFGKGRHGFIDYKESARLGRQLEGLLEDTSNDAWSQTHLAEAVITQLADVFQNADDSGGHLGQAMSVAFGLLFDLVKPGASTPGEVVDHLYQLGLRAGREARYDDFDWGKYFRNLAAQAVREPAQAAAVIELLEERMAEAREGFSGRYKAERAARLKLELIERWRSAEEAKQFRQEMLEFPSFRRRALEEALREGWYAEARTLAEEGIRLDRQNRLPGLVREWQTWLQRVAEAVGDEQWQAALYEETFLAHRSMEDYHRLKALLPAEEFAEKVEQFLAHFRKGADSYQGGYFNPMAAQILVAEGRLSELMDIIAAAPSLSLLDEYFKLLAKDFKPRFLELYQICLRREMERAGNRSDYQRLCRYLNTLMKLGGAAEARQLAAEWRSAYLRRPALLDELNKAGW